MNIKLLTYTDITLEELFLDGICVLSEKHISAHSLLEELTRVFEYTNTPIEYEHDLVTCNEFELCADEYYGA